MTRSRQVWSGVLNRPGGNATGFTLLTNQLEPKRVGLMHELRADRLPSRRSAKSGISAGRGSIARCQEAARAVNLRLFVAKANNDQELSAAFSH